MKADEYRCPPCQYLLSAGLIDARLSQWRLANVREKDLLLRFKADHTVGAITAAEAKADPFKAHDTRAALLGNSLDAGIVAYFFWELVHQQVSRRMSRASKSSPRASQTKQK